MRTFLQRWSLVIFFVLAYIISWLPSLTEPHSIFPMGPFLAALIVLGFSRGKEGLLDFVRRIGAWRVGWQWYVLVLGLPIVLNLVATVLNILFGAAVPALDRIPPFGDFIPSFLFIFVLIGIGEEPAWRGFALPRLIAGRSILIGTLLLWGLHVIWHWPLFGSEYDSTNIIPWALGLMAYTFITTWLYQHTNGNLLLPSLFHTMVNMAAQYMFNPFFEGVDLIRMYWMWALAWWVAALILYQFWPARQPLRSVKPESQPPLAEPS